MLLKQANSQTLQGKYMYIESVIFSSIIEKLPIYLFFETTWTFTSTCSMNVYYFLVSKFLWLKDDFFSYLVSIFGVLEFDKFYELIA